VDVVEAAVTDDNGLRYPSGVYLMSHTVSGIGYTVLLEVKKYLVERMTYGAAALEQGHPVPYTCYGAGYTVRILSHVTTSRAR